MCTISLCLVTLETQFSVTPSPFCFSVPIYPPQLEDSLAPRMGITVGTHALDMITISPDRVLSLIAKFLCLPLLQTSDKYLIARHLIVLTMKPPIVYAEELGRIGYGRPMWMPEEPPDASIELGDVGFIETSRNSSLLQSYVS